ncbi:hypothetical protein SAMN05421594_4238 [Chryseobacterium oleae]|uniref:Uncharacterized protein n=1 Tax=Chryseobacterium oleae TaxID=491207 RepID=A0A1I5BX07_CHROL|nr:hypothetical protein SAMN05421594_4238 [Chryseobacterium oleae]
MKHMDKTLAYSVTQSPFFAFLETYIFSIKALRFKNALMGNRFL